MKIQVLSLTPAILFGCASEVSLGSEADGVYQQSADIPPTAATSVDLLFVIDNSENMASRQRELAADFEILAEAIGRAPGGLRDLQVGVVSTDLGVGEASGGVYGCTADGDGGRFLVPSGCAGPVGEPFLHYSRALDGSTTTNFSGDIEDAFACMAELGSAGCDYEQPLEAMRRALDGTHPEALSFLRPEAVLAVVLVSDEDDCSAHNAALFDPENPDFVNTDADFRCFESGVACEGDDVYVPGPLSGCTSRRGSMYVNDVAPYVDFLDSLKDARTRVTVSGLFGDAEKVVIEEMSTEHSPRLAPACRDSTGDAALPGVRLQSFIDSFGGRGRASSLCHDRPRDALAVTAKQIVKSMGTNCLDGDLLDVDPYTPGLQIDCRVFEVGPGRASVAAGGVMGEIRACSDPGGADGTARSPCYTFQEIAPHCADFPTHTALWVHRGEEVTPSPAEVGIPDTRVIAECQMESKL